MKQAPLIAQPIQILRSDFFLLEQFAATSDLEKHIDQLVITNPFRHMTVPGGKKMSVAMTSCGDLGWISDSTGYRYSAIDPISGRKWPAMPPAFRSLAIKAAQLAGFDNFEPDSCLINHYTQGNRIGLHRDEDEQSYGQPIVSVSVGCSARFVVGGLSRRDAKQSLIVNDGDTLVWGRSARLIYHAVGPPLSAPRQSSSPTNRFNLTFRCAG